MKRFMGLMPAHEIEKSAAYKNESGQVIHIDAGPNGWTIRYPDMSTKFKDVEATTEENFQEALFVLTRKHHALAMVKDEPVGEC